MRWELLSPFSGYRDKGKTVYMPSHLPGGLQTILGEARWCDWKLCLHPYPSVQFRSVAQACPTLRDPMDCSTPGLPVHHQLLEPTQTHVHWVGDAIQPSHPLLSLSPPTLSFPASGSFQMSQLFASGGQSIGVSASTLVLPMNIQD